VSQRNVENVIGRLVTDEGFRRKFCANAAETLEDLASRGLHLNPCERTALMAIDRTMLHRFVESLDPRIQRIEIEEDVCEIC